MDDKLLSALASCKKAQAGKKDFTRQEYLRSVPPFGSPDTWGKRLKQLVDAGKVEKLEVMGHYRVVDTRQSNPEQRDDFASARLSVRNRN